MMGKLKLSHSDMTRTVLTTNPNSLKGSDLLYRDDSPTGQVMMCLRYSDDFAFGKSDEMCSASFTCRRRTSLPKDPSHTKCKSRSAKAEHIAQKRVIW